MLYINYTVSQDGVLRVCREHPITGACLRLQHEGNTKRERGVMILESIWSTPHTYIKLSALGRPGSFGMTTASERDRGTADPLSLFL